MSGWVDQGDEHPCAEVKISDLDHFVVNFDRDRSVQDKIELVPSIPYIKIRVQSIRMDSANDAQ